MLGSGRRCQIRIGGNIDRHPRGRQRLLNPVLLGLGGSFSYARLGPPLFGEYRDFGDKLPKWADLARYIFYTDTNREADAKRFDPKTGFVGSTDANGGTSYYLLYTPDETKSESLSLKTLGDLLKADKNKSWVIYCEKVWLHQEELQAFQKQNGVRVRVMQVPAGVR
jgi:hypothetical protein